MDKLRLSSKTVLLKSIDASSADLQGQQLPAAVAGKRCHPSGDSSNHRDRTDDGDVKLDMIKREVLTKDSEQSNSNALVTDTQAIDSTSESEQELKIIKREKCDDAADSVKTNSLEAGSDSEVQVVSDVHNNDIIDEKFGTHGDKTENFKPKLIKKEFDLEAFVSDSKAEIKVDGEVQMDFFPDIDELESHSRIFGVHEEEAESLLCTGKQIRKSPSKFRGHGNSNRPYSCTTCRKSFTKLSDLKRHVATEPGRTDDSVRLIDRHFCDFIPPTANKNFPQKRCKVCHKRAGVRRDSRYYCPDCPSTPGLCFPNCFRDYHTKLIYWK